MIRIAIFDIPNKMGVSENSVPLNPMVLLIIIPTSNGYFIGNMPNIFRQTQMVEQESSTTATLWWTNITMENHHFSWENPLFRLGHFQ